eukprot:1303669-Pleurochrysis_carterae.AAC.2
MCCWRSVCDRRGVGRKGRARTRKSCEGESERQQALPSTAISARGSAAEPRLHRCCNGCDSKVLPRRAFKIEVRTSTSNDIQRGRPALPLRRRSTAKIAKSRLER